MVRKLPWATTSVASTTPVKPKPAANKREPSMSSSSDEEGALKKTKAHARSKLKLEVTPKNNRGSRSPSTSPVRGPPTASPMRPGYEADDIYIMVEDELQAIAQTFTHHLHAAEYKRLKRKARDAPPEKIPELKGDASREVKRKFEVKALHDRQESVLAEEGKEKARDPWLGTSLAGLMGTSSKPKRALMGSQDIQSSTRAASGFGRGESESPTKKTKIAAMETIVKPRPQESDKRSEYHSATVHIGSKASAEFMEDTRTAARSRKWLDSSASNDDSYSKESSVAKALATKLTAKATEPIPTALARAKRTSRPPRKKFSFDDDFDMDFISSPAPDQPPAKATAKRKAKMDVKEDSKKTKLNEIPTFLF